MRKRSKNFVELAIVFLGVFSVLVWSDAHHTAPLVVDGIVSLVTPSQPVTLLFAGDVMLGRHVGKLIAREGGEYPFARISEDIETLAPDFFIANLEGPITTLSAPDTRVGPDQPYPMRFFFDPAVARALRDFGFTHLSVANNHALDQGTQGARDTIANLQNVGIVPIGAYDSSALGVVSLVTKNGHDIALIGLDTTVTWHDRAKLARELRAYPEDAFIVAFLHWGNEYEPLHSPEQESFAHFLIDSGVDLIVGAHPHVVQDVETYKGAKIYYSLGNFVFDQYWNDDVQTGLMVKVTLGGDITYEEFTIKSANSQAHFAY